MKDRQVQSASVQPGVIVLSPLLHWLAMPPILVFRSKFGYSFLSSKWIFLNFVSASVLFYIYAWMTPGAWTKYWAVAIYAVGASVFYLLRLLGAFLRETKRIGKHDHYSGTSHILRVMGYGRDKDNAGIALLAQMWIEPIVVVMTATVLKAYSSDTKLSKWLLIVAFGMWLKEAINYWFRLRSEKKHEDLIEDAEDRVPTNSKASIPMPQTGGRKPKAKLKPQTEPSASEGQKHAEVLRLMPPRSPYRLEQAEENYKTLIKAFHPDQNEPSVENTQKSAELNDAIRYFRERAE